MAAHKVDLAVDQGATFDKSFVWRLSGALVDLTGCAARSQVRASASSTTVLFDMTSANGRVELGGAAGTVRLLLTDEVTAALAAKPGVYDLFIDFPAGNSVRLMAGNFTVAQRVTRP